MVSRTECCGICEYRDLDYDEDVYVCGNERSPSYGAMICYEDICDDYEERESDKRYSL